MKPKVLIYSAKDFEVPFLEKANNNSYKITYVKERLTSQTAMLALGYEVISIFSADDASSIVLEKLRDFGVKFISLRSAGYDNINLRMAKKLKLKVANAPGYSPNAIAEHAIALLFALNRKFSISATQIKNYNFSLNNLVGFDLHKKKTGIIGTGRIGGVLSKILHGFGCTILANDIIEDPILSKQYSIEYLSFKEVCEQSEVIFLCVPLTPDTHYMIDREAIRLMQKGAFLINISRGGIVNTKEVIKALDEEKLAGYGTDVYEKEHGLFFYDHSKLRIKDELLEKLMNHPKVLLTPHQAFATKEALEKIADSTFYNINCWKENVRSIHELSA